MGRNSRRPPGRPPDKDKKNGPKLLVTTAGAKEELTNADNDCLTFYPLSYHGFNTCQQFTLNFKEKGPDQGQKKDPAGTGQGQAAAIDYVNYNITAVFCHPHPNAVGALLQQARRQIMRAELSGHFEMARRHRLILAALAPLGDGGILCPTP